MQEKIRKENINYDKWVAEGYVTVTPGNVVDYDFVKSDILRVTAGYNLKSTAYDRWNSSQTIIDLSNEGMEFNPFGQGFGSMSAPAKQFEALVLTGELEHFGNPVLRQYLVSGEGSQNASTLNLFEQRAGLPGVRRSARP